jgi:hypothetical protein
MKAKKTKKAIKTRNRMKGKVLGYGWLKAGDNLNDALTKYGIQISGKKSEKKLLPRPEEAIRDFRYDILTGKNRISARPKLFRIVLQEIED